MNNKTKKTKKEDSQKDMEFRVNAVRTVMTMSLKKSYKVSKEHFPKLDEHEFIAGLLMALVDATYPILGIDRTTPRSWVLDMVIDLLKGLKQALDDE